MWVQINFRAAGTMALPQTTRFSLFSKGRSTICPVAGPVLGVQIAYHLWRHNSGWSEIGFGRKTGRVSSSERKFCLE